MPKLISCQTRIGICFALSKYFKNIFSDLLTEHIQPLKLGQEIRKCQTVAKELEGTENAVKLAASGMQSIVLSDSPRDMEFDYD